MVRRVTPRPQKPVLETSVSNQVGFPTVAGSAPPAFAALIPAQSTPNALVSQQPTRKPKAHVKFFRRLQLTIASAMVVLGGVGMLAVTGAAATGNTEVSNWTQATRLESIRTNLSFAQIATGGILKGDAATQQQYSQDLDASIAQIADLTTRVTEFPDPNLSASGLNADIMGYVRLLERAIAAKGTTAAESDYAQAAIKLEEIASRYGLGEYVIPGASQATQPLMPLVILGWGTVGVVIFTSIGLARNTHRLFNVGLALAAVSAVAVAGWATATVVSNDSQQFSETAQQVLNAGSYRMTLAQAQQLDMDALVAESFSTANRERWDSLLTKVSTDVKASADELSTGISQNFPTVTAAHTELVKAIDAKDWKTAITLATETNPNGMRSTFAAFESQLISAQNWRLADTTQHALIFTSVCDDMNILLLPICLFGASSAIISIQIRKKEYE